MNGRSRGYKSWPLGEFEILVGTGDRDNDRLTFSVAKPHDFWLHVAGTPGSHVIVRNPERLSELPREVAEYAAALAAHFSKARGARGKLTVHLCQACDVSKPRGAPPGQVNLKRFRTLRVYARAPEGP